jgi:hypothetical protein
MAKVKKDSCQQVYREEDGSYHYYPKMEGTDQNAKSSEPRPRAVESLKAS